MKEMSDTMTINKPQLKEDIELTEKAVQQVQKIKIENNIPESHGLRVGVKGGGCSGLSYVLGFDAEPRPNDKIFQMHGVTIFIDPKSLFYLSGTQLDFQDGLNGKGFVFNNPNAQKSCGCGSSFSA